MPKGKVSKLLEYLIAFLFILPYAETGIVITMFQYTTTNTFWRAILTIEVLLFCLLIVLTIGKKSHNIPIIAQLKHNTKPFLVYAFILLLYSIIIGNATLPAITVYLMLVLPIINAYLTSKYILSKRIPVDDIIEKSVRLFVAFTIFAIFFNVIKYGFNISFSDNTRRLTSSAGGPVTFGYTIALIVALCVSNKNIFRKAEYVASLCVLFFAILLTQDRGALIVIVLCVLYLMKKASGKRMLIPAILILFIFLLFIWHGIQNSELVSRFTDSNVLEDARVSTFTSAISAYFSDWQYILFGHGYNGFFPYQDWLLNTSAEDVYTNKDFNVMVYNGRYMLVQPHNSFIYMLMEMGLVGVALFIYMIHNLLVKVGKNIKSEMKLIIFSFVCVSCLESTIFLEPGIACIFWLIVFYSFINSKYSYAQ